MQDKTPSTINIDELIDIQSISIDKTLPVVERKKSYQEQIKNHKCFRYDDIVVRVSFMETGPTLQDRIKQYLLSGQSAELTGAYVG